MMRYLFVLIAVLAGFHAYTFAKWLRRNGQTFGALVISFLIAIGVALPIYRIITAP